MFQINYLSNKEQFKYDAIIIHTVLEESTLLASLKYSKYLMKVERHSGKYSLLYTKDFKKEAKRKKSKSLVKKHKRLQKLGKVEFTRAVAENDLLIDFDIFMDVEASGWKGKHGTAIKCNEELDICEKPTFCESDDHCENGLSCNDKNRCEPSMTTCDDENKCAPGFVCHPEIDRCMKIDRCDSQSDCPDGTFCHQSENRCKEIDPCFINGSCHLKGS